MLAQNLLNVGVLISKNRRFFKVRENGATKVLINNELSKEDEARLELLSNKLHADQLFYCPTKLLFVNGEQQYVPDLELAEEEEEKIPEVSSKKSQEENQEKMTKIIAKKLTKTQEKISKQSQQVTKQKLTKTKSVHAETVYSYERLPTVIQEHPKYPLHEFAQRERVGIGEINSLKQWHKGMHDTKCFVFLETDIEGVYVKLNDFKLKNPSLVLDFVLHNCILIK